jgi:hypothetical protein
MTPSLTPGSTVLFIGDSITGHALLAQTWLSAAGEAH